MNNIGPAVCGLSSNCGRTAEVMSDIGTPQSVDPILSKPRQPDILHFDETLFAHFARYDGARTFDLIEEAANNVAKIARSACLYLPPKARMMSLPSV